MSSIEAAPSLYRNTPCGIANLPNQPAVVMRQILALGFFWVDITILRFVSTFERRHPSQSIRGTQRRFPLKYIENSFQAILSTIRSLEMRAKWTGAIKFVCVRSSQGNMSLFRITRASVRYYFPETFRCYLTNDERMNFPNSSVHHIFQPENFCFPFFDEKQPNLTSEMKKIKLQKSQGIYKISFT